MRKSPLGISTEPGIRLISYSLGSRTSTRTKSRVPSVALLEHVLELGHRDRRAGGGVGGLVGDRAAERVVVDQPGDGRVLAAERAVRVLADLQLAVLHLEGVVDHQPADQRVADAGEQLDRLVDLDRADAGAEHAEHAALGAARDHARRRRLGVEAAVAGRVVGEGRREHRGLAVEAVDRAPDVGDLQEVRRVVDHVARREVVGAVDDQVVALEDLAARCRCRGAPRARPR